MARQINILTQAWADFFTARATSGGNPKIAGWYSGEPQLTSCPVLL